MHLVPGAAPRQVDVQPLNSSALRVTWRSVLPRLRQGQVRGYQVHFSRVESGESRTLPQIKDLLLDDAQVKSHLQTLKKNLLSVVLAANYFCSSFILLTHFAHLSRLPTGCVSSVQQDGGG